LIVTPAHPPRPRQEYFIFGRTESRDDLAPSYETDAMNSKAAKLLVVESDDVLREQIVAVLRDAGYAVSADYQQGMKAVLDFDPDVVVLGADPPQLDCCDLLSEIKSSEQTHHIRVVMLSPGGSPERTRGLDLGADDVLSLPFDPHELLDHKTAVRHKSDGLADA
jgi:DNA-binding response OmpR family regulator